MLCTACEHVSHDIHNLLLTQTHDVESVLAPGFHPHSPNYRSLKTSAADGCELCKLLVRCVVDQLGEDHIFGLAPEHESLSFQVDVYFVAGKCYVEAVTFYFGYSDAPFVMRNFQLSFRVELVEASCEFRICSIKF